MSSAAQSITRPPSAARPAAPPPFDLGAALAPSPRRRRGLSLAPLIDVTFILLIFFMLVTQFSRFAPVDVALGAITPDPLAKAERPGAGPMRKVLLLLRADGAFELDGSAPRPRTELARALSDLAARAGRGEGADAEAAIEREAEDEEKRQSEAGAEGGGTNTIVLLNAQPDVPLQLLLDVLLLLEAEPRLESALLTPADSPLGVSEGASASATSGASEGDVSPGGVQP